MQVYKWMLQMCVCFASEVCASLKSKWVGKKHVCHNWVSVLLCVCVCVLLYLLYCTIAGRAPATTAPAVSREGGTCWHGARL